MNDYADTQQRRDAEYARAWEKLSPAKRKQMAKLGIHGPELPKYHTGKADDDSAMDNVDAVDATTDEGVPTPCAETPLTVVRRLFGELLSQDDFKLTLDCFSLATGIGYCGESMSHLAHKHGVTRAAVSKRCVEITNALGLKPTRAMRTLTTRHSYGNRAHNDHARSSH